MAEVFASYDNLLTALSSLNALPDGALITESGKLTELSKTQSYLVVTPISEVNVNDWTKSYNIERFQLTALATTSSAARALLNSADALISKPPYRALQARSNGKLSNHYSYTQDYEV